MKLVENKRTRLKQKYLHVLPQGGIFIGTRQSSCGTATFLLNYQNDFSLI
jgi:hypothetical protein